jgi:C4-dicarboxylate transporter DctM subunit
MVSAVLFITFFVLLVLNVPISICLGLSSAAAILYSGTSLTIVATNIYSGISKFLLLAIPFFVLSGNIMAKAGISTRLIRFVDTCVGHRKGGIANVCIIVACFFGAISGSGPATVAGNDDTYICNAAFAVSNTSVNETDQSGGNTGLCHNVSG